MFKVDSFQMKIIGIKTSTWYKTIHIVSACSWFGAVLSVVLIYLFTINETDLSFVHYSIRLTEKIDHTIIIPSSTISYLSGLLLSWRTNWGFLKYKWIVVKLILGTGLISFGIFFLGPWIIENNLSTAHQDKLGIAMILQSLIILSVIIIIIIIISTTKPWGKTETR